MKINLMFTFNILPFLLMQSSCFQRPDKRTVPCSQDTKVAAKRWKDSSNCVATSVSTVSRQHSPSNDKPGEKSKALLYKKLEERNASISNAKHRWNFIKTKTLVGGAGEDEDGGHEDFDLDNHPGIRCTTEPKTLTSPNPDLLNDIKPEIKLGVVEDNSGNVIRDQSKGAIPKIIKR